MKKIIYSAGLPRSGSTLLSSILNQNPRFESQITNHLLPIVDATVHSFNKNATPREYLTTDTKRKIIRSIVDSYHDTPGKDVFFNHNKGWHGKLDLVNSIDPNFKMIICVRDIGWILDSEERIARSNPYNIPSYLEQSSHVYSRADTMLRMIVGQTFESLKAAIQSPYTDHMLFVEYDYLTMYPLSAMMDIYEFIEEPYFYHDFNNVEASFDDYDYRINAPGLHTVRKRVEFIPRETILPKDIWNRVKYMDVWKHVEGLNYGSSRKRQDHTS